LVRSDLSEGDMLYELTASFVGNRVTSVELAQTVGGPPVWVDLPPGTGSPARRIAGEATLPAGIPIEPAVWLALADAAYGRSAVVTGLERVSQNEQAAEHVSAVRDSARFSLPGEVGCVASRRHFAAAKDARSEADRVVEEARLSRGLPARSPVLARRERMYGELVMTLAREDASYALTLTLGATVQPGKGVGEAFQERVRCEGPRPLVAARLSGLSVDAAVVSGERRVWAALPGVAD
jgi:hypothetical protein